MNKEQFIEKMKELIEFFHKHEWIKEYMAGLNGGPNLIVHPTSITDKKANCFCLLGGSWRIFNYISWYKEKEDLDEDLRIQADKNIKFNQVFNKLIRKYYNCNDIAFFNDLYLKNKEDLFVKLNELITFAENEKEEFFS